MNLRIIKIFSITFLCSLLINVVVSQGYVSNLIDSAAVNFLSVLVGLAVALHGIITPIIASLYSEIPSGEEGDKRRALLKNIVGEIKDNALFVLFSYFAVLFTILAKGIDKGVFLSTYYDQYAISFGMNVSAIMYMIFSGCALYDTTISIMKLQHNNCKKHQSS